MIFVVENEKELADIVYENMKNRLVGGFKCGLIGELGAGKTTLVKLIGSKLGVLDTITSPTFNIRKIYSVPKSVNRFLYLQHIDLYRFDKPSSADNLETLDWLQDDKSISFIEWPQKISGIVNILDLQVIISVLGHNKRKVELRWK